MRERAGYTSERAGRTSGQPAPGRGRGATRPDRPVRVRGAVGSPGRQPDGPGELVPMGRAAVELGLKPRELETALQVGAVRATRDAQGRSRVAAAEIVRLTSQPGHPRALRAQVRLVGTLEGARLLGIGAGRFARLARAGCFAPMRFYVNRYRAVVWLYLAAELEEFAEREPELLEGRTPPGVRARTEDGSDWRPRLWRERRVEQLAAETTDPWAQAALPAAVLAPGEVCDVVRDPGERQLLERLRPEQLIVRGSSEAARAVTACQLTADHADEILDYRTQLQVMLNAARAVCPLPPVAVEGGAAEPPGGAAPGCGPDAVVRERPRGLRRWLGRRTGAAAGA
ncbi:DUF6397 family protein [Streptomyces sp. NPDC051940]|uniref:DUF6397 family protein n=1 Tax=Streptomyces sp. NPDC051940 TaxID=3155675 RepID=UPI003436C4E3